MLLMRFCWETLSPAFMWMLFSHLNIPADHVHPFIAVIFPIGLFQLDDASSHTADPVQEWFEEHDKEFKVSVWHQNSPDVGPIKRLLDVLKNKFNHEGSMSQLLGFKGSAADDLVPENDTLRGLWTPGFS